MSKHTPGPQSTKEMEQTDAYKLGEVRGHLEVVTTAAERAVELLCSITDLPTDLAAFRETTVRQLRQAIATSRGES